MRISHICRRYSSSSSLLAVSLSWTNVGCTYFLLAHSMKEVFRSELSRYFQYRAGYFNSSYNFDNANLTTCPLSADSNAASAMARLLTLSGPDAMHGVPFTMQSTKWRNGPPTIP